MRVKRMELSWFRGAADRVSLEPNGKSMVVYGPNGSGKSSFVDAIEFILSQGKIGHLAHEYSGKRQERAVLNTHKPKDREAEVVLAFEDDSRFGIAVTMNGTYKVSKGQDHEVQSWDYRRTVLRQDEVSRFIQDTKGEKYSALLPLLGFQDLEVAAGNLKQLAKVIEEVSKLKETRGHLTQVAASRQSSFGGSTDAEIVARLDALGTTYGVAAVDSDDGLQRCEKLITKISERMAAFDASQRKFFILQEIGRLGPREHITAIRKANEKLADTTEPLIAERLEVLQAAELFAQKQSGAAEVVCPACGRCISLAEFQKHITSERDRLQEIKAVFDQRKLSMGELADVIHSLQTNIGKPEVEPWRNDLTSGSLAASLKAVLEVDTWHLRSSCTEEDLTALESYATTVISSAQDATREALPGTLQLANDKRLVEDARSILSASNQALMVARTEALMAFITSTEQSLREEIRLRSQSAMDLISSDIQAMWTTLHPGESISDVHLHLPEDADKAIDIGLKFHGVDQDSPRLTLSEGYRNSLGLCIFLSMAKPESKSDRPVFLDDIVVSLDRSHRGMIADLLNKEFSGRQVILLTHDRDWFAELRHQLDDKNWVFRSLLPYESPQIGIRWSEKTATFDEARAQLKDRPDSAGNDARKIMDVELALIAERLQVRLPYLRGDKNDKRMAHEFLEQLAADGKRCFQIKTDGSYREFEAAIQSLKDADRLVTSWANKASHSFDLVGAEASKLIDACEKALDYFRCCDCSKPVWFADAERSEWTQCQCGSLCWRYGKA